MTTPKPKKVQCEAETLVFPSDLTSPAVRCSRPAEHEGWHRRQDGSVVVRWP